MVPELVVYVAYTRRVLLQIVQVLFRRLERNLEEAVQDLR